MANQKDSEERPRNVKFGSTVYWVTYYDDMKIAHLYMKIAHLDAQEICALYLCSSLFPFGTFNSLRVKGSAVSPHFLQEFLQRLRQ